MIRVFVPILCLHLKLISNPNKKPRANRPKTSRAIDLSKELPGNIAIMDFGLRIPRLIFG